MADSKGFKKFERKLMRLSGKLEKGEKQLQRMINATQIMLDEIDGALGEADDILREVKNAD